MAMTDAEQKRLSDAEEALNNVERLLRAVGSKNQLNRLYVLLSRELERIENMYDSLEAQAQEVLELARKVQ